jgi:hypothetical protein
VSHVLLFFGVWRQPRVKAGGTSSICAHLTHNPNTPKTHRRLLLLHLSHILGLSHKEVKARATCSHTKLEKFIHKTNTFNYYIYKPRYNTLNQLIPNLKIEIDLICQQSQTNPINFKISINFNNFKV